MKLQKKTLYSLIVLGGAVLSSVGLIALRPEPKPRALEATLPVVEVVIAQPHAQRPLVRAQGTLEPRDEIELVAEVSGRVVWVSPAFDGAGEFAAGQTLARIAGDDYEIAAQRARAAVQRAESELSLARAAELRSQALFDAGAASPAAHEQTTGTVQVREANISDARAALAQAELALARTSVRAPFEGRVRERRVALGQYLAAGTPIARVYRGGDTEVKLALRAEDAAFIELPKRARDPGPRVTLRATIGGVPRELAARLIGASGGLDPRTRMLSVIARVEAPAAERADLAMGAFVEAEIEGREAPNLVRLPRAALMDDSAALAAGSAARPNERLALATGTAARPNERLALATGTAARPNERFVVVVDAQDQLALRAVELHRVDDDFAWVSGGLAAGERICARAPAALAPGTQVLAETAAAPAEASAGVAAAEVPEPPRIPSPRP